MSGAGADPADRALDDALALANDRRAAAPSGPRSDEAPANDPLSVALGHDAAVMGAARGSVEGSSVGGGAGGSRPEDGSSGVSGRLGRGSGSGPRSDEAPANDPLSVALRHGTATVAASRRPVDGPPPGGQPGRAEESDPLSFALGHEAGRDPAGAPGSADPPHSPGTAPRPRTGAVAATPWADARRIARTAGRRLGARVVPLGEGALGCALAGALAALTDLPSFDASAMDGWAVSGNGPWLLKGQVLAGGRPARALLDGHAVRIATGAPLPPGTTAVLRSEHGGTERRTDGEWLRVLPPHSAPAPGQETRRQGQECRNGDELMPAGTVVTPAVLGLAAAAGYDELAVIARPRVEVLVLGDELLDRGVPRAGRVRDALGPMLPSWLRALGAEVTAVRRLVDDAGALHEAIAEAVTGGRADLVITTGGTAGGPLDHLHPVLAAMGAEPLVDGVAVRPGHPMLLAGLPTGLRTRQAAAEPGGPDLGAPGHERSGRGGRRSAASAAPTAHLIGLPGNPLAAVSGVLTLVAPLLRTLAGHPVPAPYAAPLTADVAGHPVDTRLVPVVFDDESAARPLRYAGPAMLRGLAAADGMAVIPPGGARAGTETAVLDTGLLGPAWGSGL